MDLKTKCMYIVGFYLAIWIGALVVLLFCFWPKRPTPRPITDPNTLSVQITEPNGIDSESETSIETGQTDPESQESESPDSLILKQCPLSGLSFVGLVLIMGALGACLHGITSLAYHRGRNDFDEKWTLWYLYRPWVGGVLAMIFYLIINAGLISHIDSDDKKFFWILGISGLIGLFSKQALNKLSLIFDAIFAGDKDKISANAGTNPETQTESNSQDETVSGETTPEQTQS